MVVQNVSTSKKYDVTKEEFEKHFKGKRNWKVISEEEIKPVQKIDNTLSGIMKEKPKQTQTKKSNKNE